ncbi:FliH/SctL family protein [Sneathiella limimaris]|uniref:FliH/SctL family protein n=1 Tax=Sneathiella limimaris TaxID=1964213 RepID=UPI00146B7037|nr:FliH/SctL family protein [Sneathiella limimaris]
MSATSKFLFDTEFGSSVKKEPEKVEAPEPELPPAIYTEEDKERLCAEAHSAGQAAGREEVLQSVEATTAQIMSDLSSQLQQLAQAHEAQMENVRCEAASLAFAIAKKLAPSLIARQPEQEVLQMVQDCLADLHDEPRIVLRANEQVCNSLSEKVDILAQQSGFQGNIILLPDDTKIDSDCRIEWADGGVERDVTDTTQKLEEIIHRFVNSADEAKS